MRGRAGCAGDDGWTRGRLLRLAAGGGAVAVSGAAMGAGRKDGASLAAPSKGTDRKILNFFLLLEYVQEAFYRDALETTGLTGPLREFARTVARQESEHAAFLAKRLGSSARPRPHPEFGDAHSTPARFRAAAIDLEETAIAAYIGQGANLSRGALGAVGTLISVEARQVAWARDIAGVLPAPHAADPARTADDVLAHLRERRFIA